MSAAVLDPAGTQLQLDLDQRVDVDETPAVLLEFLAYRASVSSKDFDPKIAPIPF